MIVVIQCQSKKHPGRTLKSGSGKPVAFVAQPQSDLLPADGNIYARPDDLSDDGRSWRKVLLDYNSNAENPLHLYRAYDLYQDPVYRRLAERVTVPKLYILSAGWGLISAAFLTPYYDITFSQVPRDQKYKQRRKGDQYDDFAMICPEPIDRIVFFGSKSYLPLFCRLTSEVSTEKLIFYNSDEAPEAPGCMLKKYPNPKRDTNWQFDCANDFLDGAIGI